MNAVVSKTKFTGPRVNIDGYNIGGKTGTTELIDSSGRYYKDRNMTSFIGVFPTNKPKYVVYTAITYPKKPINSKQRMTGAVVNAPLVKKIIYEMIKILNLPSVRHDEFIKADIKKFISLVMLFSDLNKIFVNANIIGKLPKKNKIYK